MPQINPLGYHCDPSPASANFDNVMVNFMWPSNWPQGAQIKHYFQGVTSRALPTFPMLSARGVRGGTT